MYAVVNGVNQWLDGNRAQRKKQKRALESEAKANQTTNAQGPNQQPANATAVDPAVSAEVLELETAIGHGKNLGAGVSLYEARLHAIRPPPATAKTPTYGQAKHAAEVLERKHSSQCDSVVAAQRNLDAQQAKLEELALELEEAIVLRDTIMERDYKATKAPQPAKSLLHVDQILKGEQIQLVYGKLFDPCDPALNTDDVAHLQAIEAAVQATAMEAFKATFGKILATETEKFQVEYRGRAAKRKKVGEDGEEGEDKMDTDAATLGLPPPPNPLPPDTAPTPTDPPTPATPAATQHEIAPASASLASSSKDGGGAPPQTTPQRPKRTNAEETPEDKKKREDTAASEALRTKSISAAKKIREQKVLDSGAEQIAVDDDDPAL